jgi:hypothetical protein
MAGFDLNMKLSDFEKLGESGYNKGFVEALTIVIKILNDRICFDFKADSACEHAVCHQNFELAEGLETVKRSKQ